MIVKLQFKGSDLSHWKLNPTYRTGLRLCQCPVAVDRFVTAQCHCSTERSQSAVLVYVTWDTALCERHGVARNGSAFSGCLTNFHEGHCPTQHCALCVNSHTAVYVWTVSRRHGVARNGSAFSGCLTNFDEGHCPTQHCALCELTYSGTWRVCRRRSFIHSFIQSVSISEIHQSGYRTCH